MFIIKPLDETVNLKLLSSFKGVTDGYCQVSDKKWILPMAYDKHSIAYQSMPIREDDIWIVTFPRSGTTMCQELVWLLNNNTDYETAKLLDLHSRVPYYEFGLIHNIKFHEKVLKLNENNPKIDLIKEELAKRRCQGYDFGSIMNSPRHFKTHLPLSLLPDELNRKGKIIYVARNPKDVALSYYHHNRAVKVHDFVDDFTTYWNYFKNDLLLYSPYWEHINEGWQRRNDPNFLFLFYEDIVKNMGKAADRICEFIDKPKLNREDIEKLKNHMEINNFKKNVKVFADIPINGLRNTKEQLDDLTKNGQNNGVFTESMAEEADKWIALNQAKIGLRFPGK